MGRGCERKGFAILLLIKRLSRADQSDLLLTTDCVTLHAARVGGRPYYVSVARCCRQSTFRPWSTNIKVMATPHEVILCDIGEPAFNNEATWFATTRPERTRKMLGVEGRRINGFLKVASINSMLEEKQRRPLILLISTRCSPSKVWPTITQCKRWRESRPRSLSGRKCRRRIAIKPKHLSANRHTEAKLRHDRRALQPAARWCCSDDVSKAVNNIEMTGVTAIFAHWGNSRFTKAPVVAYFANITVCVQSCIQIRVAAVGDGRGAGPLRLYRIPRSRATAHRLLRATSLPGHR